MNKKMVWYSSVFLLTSGPALQTTQAAPLNLAQYPAGVASREPAPNVIVTVDDSSSMEADGIKTLKDALRQTFSEANLADGSIRLGWQSMNGRCNSIPESDCDNGVKVFKGSHRTNFLTWVDTLQHAGNTPGHRMVRNAGDYLKRTDLGINSPWASEPGVKELPLLSCRRSYHIFMTDGGWNSTGHTNHYTDADRNVAGYTAIEIKGKSNLDNTPIKLGDGITDYIPIAPYKDEWGFATTKKKVKKVEVIDQYGLNTLSDLAFHYWATDLQPSMANDIKPQIRKGGDETFTSGKGRNAKSATLTEFWNPKNNPATWQHMTTYTIGFSAGTQWTGQPRFGSDNYSGDFNQLVTGEIKWPSPLCDKHGAASSTGNSACDGKLGNRNGSFSEGRRMELWHMALNGRGKFIPASTPDALAQAFKDIVSTITSDARPPISSFTSASSSVTHAGTTQYSSGYSADGWSGYIRSDTLAQGEASAAPNAAWSAQTTADKLDALHSIESRLILTTNSKTAEGVEFRWTSDERQLSASQKELLNGDAQGENRVNFLRGDRKLEGDTSAKPFRIRQSRQGDIVNSALWYVGTPVSRYTFKGYQAFAKQHAARLPMLYVGANDGMLHGFSAVDGSEKIAYVPQGVISELPKLSQPGYNHRYYVDGSPFSGDVNQGSDEAPDWRTLLVGTLGAGGKGYFVLDITQPGSTATAGPTAVASNFSASNAVHLVVMDKTATAGGATTGQDADIGHIFALPITEDNNPQKSTQIVRLNNGRWAVVMGNGYNSHNERPVLLIQYLDREKELHTLVAARTGDDATANGLSAPRLVDINGDGIPDVVYAGDLRGNLWKFDISAADPKDWHVAFDGKPLYTAVHTTHHASSPQPITAAPVVKANDRGGAGLMVAFGTGRNLTEGDRSDDSSVHTIYSVLDSTTYKIEGGKVKIAASAGPVGTGWGSLVEQTVSSTPIKGKGSSAARTFWMVSQHDVNYKDATRAKHKGWFMHLPVKGERLLDRMSFYDGSNVLEVLTEVPGSGGNLREESCSPPVTLPKLYRTFLNIMDGKKPSVQIIDSSGDGTYRSTDKSVSRMTASVKESRISTGAQEIRTGSDGVVDHFAKMPDKPLRPSWRQLR